MAVRFQFSDERHIGLIAFAWSPLFEAVLSLLHLAQPRPTPMHLPWVRRCRAELPPRLLEELRLQWRAFAGPPAICVPGIFEVGLLHGDTSFESEVAGLRGLDLATVVHELTLPLGGHAYGTGDPPDADQVHERSYRDEVLRRARIDGRAEFVEAAFDDPAAVIERFAQLLERYWEALFEQEWARLVPRIEAEAHEGARALATRGAAGLVEDLLPEGTWEAATRSIVVERSWDATVDVLGRGGMLYVPTRYGWPRVLLELQPPWPLAIVSPLRELRNPEVPLASDQEVADGLRALGDETRLQIARMVAEQPRSTKELAELLKLSDSAVSRHLKVLEVAGVVDKQRAGYFVLYRLRGERIGQIGSALRRTLGLRPTAAGHEPALPVDAMRNADAVPAHS